MTKSITTYFRLANKEAKLLPFGGRQRPVNFNYVKYADSNPSNLSSLSKHTVSSCRINISYVSEVIPEVKLTNQSLLTWDDYWVDEETGQLADPKIEKIDLRNNSLISANFNLPRTSLSDINLSGNTDLSCLFLTQSPNIRRIDLSNCQKLSVVNLGQNSKIEFLSARGCNLNTYALERLLRDFRPVVTSPSNTHELFRKEYHTLLDLRGNDIDWSNRRIASKIRLLLCNNWLVLWDSAPPPSIVPVQMYAFFTNNLEQSMIRTYYG